MRKIGWHLVGWFFRLVLVAVPVLGFVFLLFGGEGAIVSTGIVGEPGHVIVTRCGGAGQGHHCFGTFYPDRGTRPWRNVQYEGDGGVGGRYSARLWSGEAGSAWQTDWWSWYRWVFPLAGGLAADGATLFFIGRAIIRMVRGRRPM